MVEGVKQRAGDWKYEVVEHRLSRAPCSAASRFASPTNLGKGWVGFDFAGAFGCPVKLINDAAMQALGSYAGRQDAVPGPGHRPGLRR